MRTEMGIIVADDDYHAAFKIVARAYGFSFTSLRALAYAHTYCAFPLSIGYNQRI